MKRSRLVPPRALASTVLRSSAVSENSAATNTPVPAVSAKIARMVATVSVRFTGGSVVALYRESQYRPLAWKTDGVDGCPRHVIPFARNRAARYCGFEVHIVAR